MRARTVLALVSAITIATAATAADAPAPTSPWEGFGVGSWVRLKKTSKLNAPGLATPEEATETRETLVRVSDDAHTTNRETKTATGWESSGEFPYSRLTATAAVPDDGSGADVEREDLGTEKVAVEGKAIDCKKSRTKFGTTVTTTWTAKPYGIVKTVIDSDAGGGRTTDVRTVTAWAKKVKLAGKELVCRETTTFTKMEVPGVPSGNAGDGTTGVELASDAVPGHRVRMEISGKRGPVRMTSLEELVAFETKPP